MGKLCLSHLLVQGRAVFAIDITNPDNIEPSNVLWEFTNTELGYVAQPTIGRLSTGAWVAIIGNGFNSNSNKAKLLVVDLNEGTLLKTIDTGVGSTTDPNGLGAPLIVDKNGDRIY